VAAVVAHRLAEQAGRHAETDAAHHARESTGGQARRAVSRGGVAGADAEVQRLLSLQLSVLGAVRFARERVLPLVYEIGERWASERLGVGSEHLSPLAFEPRKR
jgi:hypothetical protein